MNNTRMEELNKELNRIINVIVNDYCPEKIILFGSLVSGNIHDFSDIDLIVIKDSEKPFYERLKEIILLTMPSVAADIFVYTPDEFENIQDRLFIQEEVIQKGKVLYNVH
jgi:predicted nucleotidyltransferase